MLSGDPPLPSLHRVIRDGDLLGVIAIDSTVDGRARGGLRMVADVSEDEIRSAARAMTLKYGLLGLPPGGAKAGIVGDAEVDSAGRQGRLREFAEAARPLLEPGRLHYFDTTRVHTLVNPGPSQRITLSFDLVANAWLRERFPAILQELQGQSPGTVAAPSRPSLALAWGVSRLYPLRSRAGQWRRRSSVPRA